MALTEAQKRAKKNYEMRNREKTLRSTHFRSTKSFIKTKATLEELENLKAVIAERQLHLINEERQS